MRAIFADALKNSSAVVKATARVTVEIEGKETYTVDVVVDTLDTEPPIWGSQVHFGLSSRGA